MLTSKWKPIATGASYADEQMEAYRHRCLVCWRADGSLSPPVPRMLTSRWKPIATGASYADEQMEPIATGASYAGEQMEPIATGASYADEQMEAYRNRCLVC